MKSYILLEDVEFYAFHGVLEQERKVGNIFIVDLKIGIDISNASKTDDIADTINYAEVYNVVRKEMQIPSNLIEHVAKRTIDRLKDTFPEIETIEIKLSKRNPPVDGQVKYASVVIID